MTDLTPSLSCRLGRKEYWSDFYSTELENFGEFGDTGDVWFGKKNLERIVKWLIENKVEKVSPILDVGCGNGMTLVSLAKVGFQDLTGVDYADEAILLAEKVAEDKNVNITFRALDFLQAEPRTFRENSKTFFIVIDKGTYDAICLDTQHAEEKRRQYVKKVLQLLSDDGYFMLFSCNWTKEELLMHFQELKMHDEIEIPGIGFGGKTGQTVTALVMKKYL